MSDIQVITIAGRYVTCPDWVEWNKFKEWVMGTSLYHAILEHSGHDNHTLHYGDDAAEGGRLRLDFNNTKISSFEELPIEILIKFYENSPWYNNNSSIQKLLTWMTTT